MSIYHVATLTGSDQVNLPWKVTTDWSQGFKITGIEVADKPLNLNFLIYGLLKDVSLETFAWHPGIEKGCLLGYFSDQSQTQNVSKVRFDLSVGSLGVYLGLCFESCVEISVGWKSPCGPILDIQNRILSIEGESPIVLNRLSVDPYVVSLLEGKVHFTSDGIYNYYSTEKTKAGNFKLLIGRRIP